MKQCVDFFGRCWGGRGKSNGTVNLPADQGTGRETVPESGLLRDHYRTALPGRRALCVAGQWETLIMGEGLPASSSAGT